MAHPLKINVRFLPECDPVIDALQALHVDIGSCAASYLDPSAPAGARMMCVVMVDAQAVDNLAAQLADALKGTPAAQLAKRARVVPTPFGTYMVAFLDIIGLAR